MRRIAFLRVAAASLGAPLLPARAQRPNYGGTLIVETRARGGAWLGPNEASVDLRRVAGAVYEGLVAREEDGALVPRLATAWSHDGSFRQWRFTIRSRVRAHDGTAITPALVASALSRLLSPRVVSATADSVTVQCGQAEPLLPSDLAEPRYRLVWKTGTGPFKVVEWIAGQRGVLAAHDAHWEARPFLDAIEVRLGRSLRDQLLDWEGGRADVVELPLAEARRQAALPGRAVWVSAALDLVALAFVRTRPTVQDERVRRGIAAAIDRAPIAQVLLQRFGEPAGSFLPHRVSGYGFLFGVDRDLDRASQLLKPPPAAPLVIGYDAAEPSLRLIAERIALNVREAGVTLKPSPTDEPDLVLIRVPATAADPALALAEYGRGLQMPLPPFGRSREDVFQAERKSLVGGWVVPLFHVPSAYGVRPRVRKLGKVRGRVVAIGRHVARRRRRRGAVSFRTRLILMFALVAAAVAVSVSAATAEIARRALARVDDERTRAIVQQFRREYALRGREVARRVEAMASSEAMARLAAEMTRPGADPSPYVEQAATLAREQDLEIVEIVGPGGAIVSSAHYPARFGYRKPWVLESTDWKALGPFAESEEFPDGPSLALLAVRAVTAPAGGAVYLIGGERLDRQFLSGLTTPRGMTAELYRGAPANKGAAAELIARIRSTGQEAGATTGGGWTAPRTMQGIPLLGRSRGLLGVLLVTSVREEMWSLTWFIRAVGLAAAAAGIALGVLLAWWLAARIARPVRQLAGGAREVAAGNWTARVPVEAGGELGELGRAFNLMTAELSEQKRRLVQAERVAAWRELARRLAHELKNPLFPLQLTVENLQRARDSHPEQFDEVFRESTSTLLAELAQLKTIVGRFSDFARMPTPRIERVNLDTFLPPILKLFEPQWSAPGQPPIRGSLELAERGLTVDADPDPLARALRNLILNAMDAMPQGGPIAIRARRDGKEIAMEVSDTGAGLTREECERLFTPYYTTKQHGTGLGLAIVQSVVSDHGGRISVESEPGKGSTFRIALPTSSESNGQLTNR